MEKMKRSSKFISAECPPVGEKLLGPMVLRAELDTIRTQKIGFLIFKTETMQQVHGPNRVLIFEKVFKYDCGEAHIGTNCIAAFYKIGVIPENH